MKKEDRRVTKSKSRIREGLFMLLEEKKISDITVIELTSRAKINRKTFYNHYTSVYDVVHELEDECLERYKIIFSRERIYEYKNRINELFELLINEITENEEMYRVMTHSDIHLHFSGKLTDAVKEWLRSLSDEKDEKKLLLLEYYYDFISSGMINVLHKWLLSDEKIEPELLGKFFQSVAWSDGVKEFFNIM